jgi:hypothetical protein
VRWAADCGVHQVAAVDAVEKLCEGALRIATFLVDFGIRKSTRETIADAVSLNIKRCSGSNAF